MLNEYYDLWLWTILQTDCPCTPCHLPPCHQAATRRECDANSVLLQIPLTSIRPEASKVKTRREHD